MNLGLLAAPVGSDQSLRKYVRDYIRAVEYLGPNTSAGYGLAANTWTTRQLNLLLADYNEITNRKIGALPSGQFGFTIPPGKYRVSAFTDGFAGLGANTIRVRDITAGTTLGVGSASYLGSDRARSNHAWLVDVFTIYRDTVIELQHITEATNSQPYGAGHPGSFDVGVVYSQIELLRVAS